MICNPPSKNDLTSESPDALVCYNKFIMEEMQEKTVSQLCHLASFLMLSLRILPSAILHSSRIR